MNVIFALVAWLVPLGLLLAAFGSVPKNRWSMNPNACELPRVRFSDTVSTATDIIEAGTLGRLWFHLSLFSSMMTGMEE